MSRFHPHTFGVFPSSSPPPTLGPNDHHLFPPALLRDNSTKHAHLSQVKVESQADGLLLLDSNGATTARSCGQKRSTLPTRVQPYRKTKAKREAKQPRVKREVKREVRRKIKREIKREDSSTLTEETAATAPTGPQTTPPTLADGLKLADNLLHSMETQNRRVLQILIQHEEMVRQLDRTVTVLKHNIKN